MSSNDTPYWTVNPPVGRQGYPKCWDRGQLGRWEGALCLSGVASHECKAT